MEKHNTGRQEASGACVQPGFHNAVNHVAIPHDNETQTEPGDWTQYLKAGGVNNLSLHYPATSRHFVNSPPLRP